MIDTVIVVKNDINGNKFIGDLNDDTYIARIDDAESDSAEFNDAVIADTVGEKFELVPLGSVSIPIYRVVRFGTRGDE